MTAFDSSSSAETENIRILAKVLPPASSLSPDMRSKVAEAALESDVRAIIGGAGSYRSDHRTAVIVVHGMGQQVPFQTIDELAHKLINASAPATAVPALQSVICRFVKLNDTTVLPRAEFTLSNSKSEQRDVHLYEGYWAPLTEGRITLPRVVAFCLEAGIQGLRFSKHGNFNRWIFGDWVEFPLEKSLFKTFMLAILIFVALAAVNIFTVATAFKVVTADNAANTLLPALTADLLWMSVPGALLVWTLFRLLKTDDMSTLKATAQTNVQTAIENRKALNKGYRDLLKCTIVGTAFSAGFMGAHLYTNNPHLFPWDPPSCPELVYLNLIWFVLGVLLWILVVGLSYVVRTFVLQYLGDVCIYLSSYRVSQFAEIKDRIKEQVSRAAYAIYSLKDSVGKHYYDDVIVVAHSLGSVVAYDSLNSMINADLLSPDATGEQCANRTKLFLTFGSPLDKSAFVFRTQNDRADVVREALAAAVQPMILDYAYRPARWYNIWSKNDIISGALDYYDEEWKHPSKSVINLEDPDCDLYLLAHNQYWSNELFNDLLGSFARGDEDLWETKLQTRTRRTYPIPVFV